MKKLMLVAAGGLAREALDVERLLDRFEEIRVVDDNPALWGGTLAGERIVGGLDLVPEYDDHHLLVCAGRGPARRRIVERLCAWGVDPRRFATVVHPRVLVPPGCSVGAGSILLEGAVLTAQVRVGNHVVVMPHVTLTHDDVVEDYATLCAGVTLGGAVRVRSGAYLGMNSCVRERLTVGVDATLGMGAALVDDLPDGQTWAGTPARPLVRAELLGEA
jgi:sugar O-acyltransferase (sialic acid O-acetyltransferase NeuD family)